LPPLVTGDGCTFAGCAHRGPNKRVFLSPSRVLVVFEGSDSDRRVHGDASSAYHGRFVATALPSRGCNRSSFLLVLCRHQNTWVSQWSPSLWLIAGTRLLSLISLMGVGFFMFSLATTVTPKEQLCYLGKFAPKLGENGYHKPGQLKMSLGFRGWILRNLCCRERLDPRMLANEPVFVRPRDVEVPRGYLTRSNALASALNWYCVA